MVEVQQEVNLIGRQLGARRKHRKISRRRLAQVCDLTEDTVAKAEKDSSARPLYVIERIAKGLGLRLVLLDDADLVVVTQALRDHRAAQRSTEAAGRLQLVGRGAADADQGA